MRGSAAQACGLERHSHERFHSNAAQIEVAEQTLKVSFELTQIVVNQTRLAISNGLPIRRGAGERRSLRVRHIQ